MHSDIEPRKRGRIYRFMAAGGVVLAMLLALLAPATAAYAGANGQHVYFSPSAANGYMPGQLGNVQISGQNQCGCGNVSWSGTSTDGHSLTLGNGWWWKGTVTIKWSVRGSNAQHVTTAWVPPDNRGGYQVSTDTVWVNSLGTLYYGTSAAMPFSEGYGLPCGPGIFGALGHYIKYEWWTGWYYDAGHNIQGRSWISGRFGGGPSYPSGMPIQTVSTGAMLACG